MSGTNTPAVENHTPLCDEIPEEDRPALVDVPQGEQVTALSTAVVDADVDASVVEGSDIEKQVNDVMAAVTSMEAIDDLMASCVQNGGMSVETERAINIALEGICDRLNVYDSSIKLSLESYGVDRVEGTKLAMEGLGETVRAVWDAIVKMIGKIVRWASDLLGDHLTFAAQLEKRRLAIEKSLGYIKGNKAHGDIEDSALLKRLYSPEVRPRDVPAAYKDFATTILDTYLFLVSKHSAEINAIIENAKKYSMMARGKSDKATLGPDLSKTVLDLVQRAIKELFNNNSGNLPYVPKAPGGTTAYSTDLKLGNVGWFAHCPDSWETIDSLRMGTFHGDNGEFDFLPVLTVQEIGTILASAGSLKRMLGLHKDLISQVSGIQHVVELIARQLPAQYNDRDATRENTKAIRAVLKIFSSKGLTSYALMIRTSRDALRLCEESVKEHAKAEGVSTTPSKSRDLVPAAA